MYTPFNSSTLHNTNCTLTTAWLLVFIQAKQQTRCKIVETFPATQPCVPPPLPTLTQLHVYAPSPSPLIHPTPHPLNTPPTVAFLDSKTASQHAHCFLLAVPCRALVCAPGWTAALSILPPPRWWCFAKHAEWGRTRRGARCTTGSCFQGCRLSGGWRFRGPGKQDRRGGGVSWKCVK